ncbi:MAG: hypothetical protein HZA59_00880 [Hydrogenophilales bacterium]|nr:hypothetical protein [Hydrogenophilales bacterium]
MRLPNAGRAVVDIVKLRDYCLNVDHPRGRHKARLFAAALGITAEDAGELRELFLLGIGSHEAIPGVNDAYGERYTIDMPVARLGRKAVVRTAWIVKSSEDFPRPTSCFVL